MFARKVVSVAVVALALVSFGEAERVMNLVNFVRSLDPRAPHAEYVKVLENEVALNRKYGLANTILLQYDALIDREMMAVARKSDPAKTEFGLWFEMSRPLNEAAGLKWTPKHDPKWDWDWYINPGFLMAYTQAERKALIDTAFRKFREEFGTTPKSVGSWLLDAWSMDYMVKAYGVDGFCICREQDNTDAYGLRGGYSNGAYYPSRKNMLSAAVDSANAIPAPVFKMLTPDPLYNYGIPRSLYPDHPLRTGCATMEPVWEGGYRKEVVDWYFRTYVESPGLLNLSYMQTGQENSFGWERIGRGLPYQCERIAAYRDAGKLRVETMGETARRFKRLHPVNCPQTQVALQDWTGKDRKSIWYNSRFYRANLFFDAGRLAFRDIHKMCDGFEEPFLNSVCTGWKAEYFTPPVVDACLAKADPRWKPVALAGTFVSVEPQAVGDDVLVVKAQRKDGTIVSITFWEGQIRVSGDSLPTLKGGRLTFQDFAYEVGVARKADGVTIDLSR